MKLRFLIILILFPVLTKGQNRTIKGEFEPNGDTATYYRFLIEEINTLGLPKLDTISKGFYIRIWTSRQVFTIKTDVDGLPLGDITTWITEDIKKSESRKPHIYKDVHPLSADTASNLIEIYYTLGIDKIPSDDSIPNWIRGFDGITYLIEEATPIKYVLKTYWTPEIQDTLKEANTINKLLSSIRISSNATLLLNDFDTKLPYKCFTYNNQVMCKIKPYKSKRKKQSSSNKVK